MLFLLLSLTHKACLSHIGCYYYYFILCELIAAVLNTICKSLLVSMSLLSIATDFNNADVSMVSIFPLISHSSALLSKNLKLNQARLQELVSPPPSYSTTTSTLWQDLSICLSFCFFHFHSLVNGNSDILRITTSFFLLTNSLLIWLCDKD